MIKYKKGIPSAPDFNEPQCVIGFDANNRQYAIPFDPANTDYQTFKKEVLAGAELQDAEGVVMTQEQANAFIGTLP
jgi:hypothetical protein